VRSRPGAARTILLSHIISARPSKQPLMVRTFLKVYMEFGFYFLFLQEQIKDINNAKSYVEWSLSEQGEQATLPGCKERYTKQRIHNTNKRNLRRVRLCAYVHREMRKHI
jgi:hypothetical protein